MVRPKYKNLKIAINDNSMRISLKEDGRGHARTHFYVNADFDFISRKELLRHLINYLEEKLFV